MSLVQSQPTLQRRAERFRPGDCNGDQDVTKARNNAKDLARSVKGSGNAALCDLISTTAISEQPLAMSIKGYRTMKFSTVIIVALRSNALSRTKTLTIGKTPVQSHTLQVSPFAPMP